ncbi:fungal-specific transcription factor domain-containing protein [Aspergillus heterothallicus]
MLRPNGSLQVPLESESDASKLDIRHPVENISERNSNLTIGFAVDEHVHDSNDRPATDGMVVYSSDSPINHGEGDTFTLSASFSFATKVCAATLGTGNFQSRDKSQSFNRQRRRSRSQALRDPQTDEAGTAPFAFRENESLYSLPHRHVAIVLLDRFFCIVYPATPYVLEGEIRRRFDRLWTSDTKLNPLWLAQINMIFALSCQFCQSKPDQDPLLGDSKAAGGIFYREARRYIAANASRRTSVSMLQLLLLEINYYQGTGQANECWLSIGVAVRTAQALGLHRKLPQNSAVAPMTQSLYKRLWWGCYYLDRTSSMVYGLPMGIPPLRLQEHEGAIPSPTEGGPISSNPSPHTLFHHTIRLYIIMDEIWSELRQVTLDHQMDDDRSLAILSVMAGFDKRLLQWHKSLPRPLIFPIDHDDGIEDSPNWAQSQKIMLKLRFLAMRINLHRQSLIFLLRAGIPDPSHSSSSPPWPPIFSDIGSVPVEGMASAASIDSDVHSQAEYSLAHISARICIHSAQMLIWCIERYRQRQLTGSWWWNLHFVFNSLSVMCASMSLPEPHFSTAVSDTQAAKMTIRRGFKVLRQMSSQWGNQVEQSNKFLLSLLKTMLQSRGQDLDEIFTDEQPDDTAPEYQNTSNDADQYHNLGQISGDFPPDLFTWEQTRMLDPSWALQSQLFTWRDLPSVPTLFSGEFCGQVNSDTTHLQPDIVADLTSRNSAAHYSLELDQNPAWLL